MELLQNRKMLNKTELEILKRIKYGLSLDALFPTKEELINLLISLKTRDVLKFNSKSDIENPELIKITPKGERLYTETVYEPTHI